MYEMYPRIYVERFLKFAMRVQEYANIGAHIGPKYNKLYIFLDSEGTLLCTSGKIE